MLSIRPLFGLSAALPLLAGSSTALAGGGPGAFGDVCNLQVPYMTDLDQGRGPGPGVIGLPGNGSQYCVPTCTMDLLTYLANNGYPDLDPNPGPWSTPAVYNQFTQNLAALGTLMQTSATTGTNGTNADAGITSWLANRGGNGDIVFTSMFTTQADAPELGDLALGLLAGQLVSGSVGWYTPPSGVGPWVRSGGHCFPVTGLPGFCTANRQLRLRDPAGGGILTEQSIPVSRTVPIFTRTAVFASTNAQGFTTSYAGPLECLVNFTSGGNIGHLDSFRAFAGAFGITPSLGGINQYTPKPLTGGARPTHHTLPGGGALVQDIALAPNLIHVLVALAPSESGGAPSLHIVNTATGETTPVALLVPAVQKVRVAMGTSTTASYVGSGGVFICIDDIDGESPEVEATVTLPGEIDSVSYDRARRRFMVLVSSTGSLVELTENLASMTTRTLPAAVQVSANSRLACSPRGGETEFWIVTPEADAAYRVTLDVAGGGLVLSDTISGPDIDNPTCIDTDDRGHVFIVAGGQVKEFAPPPTPGAGWEPVLLGKFAALTPDRLLLVAKSRSNVDPAIHDVVPDYADVLPTDGPAETADCDADYNSSGEVTVQDIYDFLSDWNAGYMSTNFNGVSGVTVQDIYDFLAAWSAGCQ